MRRVVLVLVLVAIGMVTVWMTRGSRQTEAPEPPATNPSGDFLRVPPDTLPIAWSDWSVETFRRAAALGRPVVAILDAAWSETSQLYAATLAADASAHRALETVAIPVRVDIDRRPDVHTRYHVELDEIPTLVYLTPKGDLWDLSPMVTPTTLTRTLYELQQDMESGAAPPRDPGLDLLAARLGQRHEAPERDSFVMEVLEELAATLPSDDVELTAASAFLESDALAFLHAVAEQTGAAKPRALFLQTLQHVLHSPALDAVSGCIEQELEAPAGRVSRLRGLDANGRLLRDLLAARDWDPGAGYDTAATRLTRWLFDTLFDPQARLFRHAQGTLLLRDNGWPLLQRSEQQRLTSGHRASLPAPHVVGVYPTLGNALAAQALAGLTGREELPVSAGEIVDRLLPPTATGVPAHDYTHGNDNTLVPGSPAFLGDVAEVGLALLALRSPQHEAAWLPRARQLGQDLMRFWDEDVQLFTDIRANDFAPSQAARMQLRLFPPIENARAARFLAELARATGENRFGDAAARVVRSLLSRSQGFDVWTQVEVAHAALVVGDWVISGPTLED